MKHYIFILAALLILAMPMTSTADDTEIYGTTSVEVQPNVMIIMDNSGSMSNEGSRDVGGDPYDPGTDYSEILLDGYYARSRNAVYYKRGNSWDYFTSSVSDIKCADAVTELSTKGFVHTKLKRDTRCGSDYNNDYDLRTGNFINYTHADIGAEWRYVVAKNAIVRLLESTTDKRFGLMHFNDPYYSNYYGWLSDGGYVKFPCGTSNETIINYINGMDAEDFSTSTPLAETQVEAGLYFAGEDSWFNSGVRYTSPIEEPCQKNYIIIMTDGEPTSDDDSKLYTWDYIISGKKIATSDQGSASLLDDVSKFLYDNDISTMGEGTSLAKQNVITYTIGLTTDQQLLSDTADNGGGEYFYADTVSSLDEALQSITNSINETNAVFLAPSVPVNRSTRTEQSNWLYLAFFKPQSGGEWVGNIKKYAIGDNGEVYGKVVGSDDTIDTSLNVVDEYGTIMQNACSFWTTNGADGGDATTGGLGEQLQKIEAEDETEPDIMVNRNVYMLTGDTPDPDITADANLFTTSNTALSSMDSDVINTARKLKNTWHLGAIIHSEPAVVHYNSTQSVIYVGANDGMIHAFDDTDGSELWAFVPPGQVSRLSLLGDNTHNYYVDGSPAVTYGDLMEGTSLFQPKDLIIGERRGGNSYYVIDISNYSRPQYKFAIESDILAGYTLGQSWCKPVTGIVSSGTVASDGGATIVDVTKEKEVFLLGGGYDVNQDLDTPEASDTVGKAIISVNTEDGTLGPFIANASSLSGMTHCIVDISTDTTYTDTNGTEIITRVYAGDLGGKVFVFSDDINIETVDGNAMVVSNVPSGEFNNRFCLFDTQGKKIFYSPQNSRIGYSRNEWVVFGTGDREAPLKTSVQNGIYAVKNDWLNSNLTEDDLFDTTENLIAQGTETQAKDAEQSLASAKGWFVNFYDPGEKLISRPIIIQDYLYFTTYVPSSDGDDGSDPCSGAGALGTSYLWSIHLSNGVPINDTDRDSIYEKPERREQIAVMAQPTLASATMLSTPKMIEIPTSINFKYFFWRQQ